MGDGVGVVWDEVGWGVGGLGVNSAPRPTNSADVPTVLDCEVSETTARLQTG